jgi:hypothetical protein
MALDDGVKREWSASDERTAEPGETVEGEMIDCRDAGTRSIGRAFA